MATIRKPGLGEEFITPWGRARVTRRSAKSVTLRTETGMITRPYAEVATYRHADEPEVITVQVGSRTKDYPAVEGLAEHLAAGGVITSLYGLTDAARQAKASDPKVEAVEGWVDLDDGNEGVVYLIRATPRPGRHTILGAARLS